MAEKLPIQIRSAEAKDAEAIRAIYADPVVYSATLQLPYPSSSIWESRVQVPIDQGIRLVADYEDTVIGEIFIGRFKSPRIAHVLSIGMGVHTGYQGCGVGYRLLSEAVNYGFNWLNAERIELEVYVDNVSARGLYEKVGFVKEGVKRKGSFRNGEYADVVQMSLLRDDWRKQ